MLQPMIVGLGKSSRSTRLNFEDLFSSLSTQSPSRDQQSLVVASSNVTGYHPQPIVIDPQSILPYRKNEIINQLRVHVSKLILYQEVNVDNIKIKINVGNKTITIPSISTEKFSHKNGVHTLFQFSYDSSAIFSEIETSEIKSAFEVESTLIFLNKAIGIFNICCETVITNQIINKPVPIIAENRKVGEVVVSMSCKAEGFLDDSASEDEDQASASPTPMPSRYDTWFLAFLSFFKIQLSVGLES